MARRKSGLTKGYGWDRIVGGLGLLFDLLGVLLIGFATYVMVGDPKAKAQLLKQLGSLKQLDSFHSAEGVTGIGALALALVVLHVVVHLGIFRSQKWAFIIAAFVGGYHLATGGYGYGGFLLAYTVLRLGQTFGPTLR